MTIEKENNSERAGITRRSLLRAGAITVGALGVPGLAGSSNGISAEKEKFFDREVRSCCQFCQVRCTTLVQVKDDRVVNVYGNPDNYWTEGGMCPKGQVMVELTYSPHRLLYPLLRDGGEWKRISYSDAVDLVAEKVIQTKKVSPEDYAHQAVMFAPLWESRESELAATMAMRLAGFPDVCHPGDTCVGNSGAALDTCLGSPITSTTLDEILNAQVLILWGANIAEIYPLYSRWIDKARAGGTKVLYIDPRRTPTSNQCDEQILPRPGTDGALALGVIRMLIKENRYDSEFVSRHVNGFEELAEACEPYTPELAARICWISEQQVKDLASLCANSRKTILWLSASLSRYTNSIQTVRAIVALQAITGNLSGAGKGLMNVQGGKPGGGEAFEEHFSSRDLAPALSYRKTLYNMERGRVKVLFLNSSYRRYPDANRVKKAITKVDFVVYRGFFMDEEANLAHLIIPATMVFESSGSQYGAQRQVVWREKVIPRPGETVEDWRFYSDLGKKIVGEAFPSFEKAEDVYELFREFAPSWKGLSLERLKQSPTGISWPCPSENHPGTKGSLYPNNRFLTPSGKVELYSSALGRIDWSEPKGSPWSDAENAQAFPLVFIQGKVVQHWQHTYTNWSAYMAQYSEGNVVQIHPETARSFGINDGDRVRLETEAGSIKAKAKLSELILPGVVWTPSHPTPNAPYRENAGQSINTIIPSYWDKVAAQFNGFGCRLIKE